MTDFSLQARINPHLPPLAPSPANLTSGSRRAICATGAVAHARKHVCDKDANALGVCHSRGLPGLFIRSVSRGTPS